MTLHIQFTHLVLGLCFTVATLRLLIAALGSSERRPYWEAIWHSTRMSKSSLAVACTGGCVLSLREFLRGFSIWDGGDATSIALIVFAILLAISFVRDRRLTRATE